MDVYLGYDRPLIEKSYSEICDTELVKGVFQQFKGAEIQISSPDNKILNYYSLYLSREGFPCARIQFNADNGNCGILHINNWISYTGKGAGREVLQILEFLASRWGYTIIECTVAEYQQTAKKHLVNAGYKQQYTFNNRRSGNKCYKFKKELS